MEQALVNWINSFEDLPKQCSNFGDLTDGLILAEIVSQISSHPVDVKKEAENNDFLKISNLNRIMRALENFYQDELNLSGLVQGVDINALVKENDLNHVQKLVELILGAAVECSKKVIYIPKILGLDPVSQRELMMIIENIMHSHNVQKSQSSENNTTENGDNDEFLRELDEKQVNMSQEQDREFHRLQSENEKLHHDYSDVVSENSNLKSEKQNLINIINQLEESLEKMKVEKSQNADSKLEETSTSFEIYKNPALQMDLHEQHNLRDEIEEKQATIVELKKKVDELSKVAAEARSLRDDNDILKEKAERVSDLEDRIKKLSIKADQTNDLKKQIKILEDQSESMMQSKLELEDSEKKFQQLKSQLDKYKDQVMSYSVEVNSLKVASENKDIEISKLKNEYENVSIENKRLQSRSEQLKQEIENLKQEQDANLLNSNNDLGDSMDRLTDFSVKEKLMRLERENKSLKLSGGPEKITELENKLDDATRLNNKYAQDIELLKKKAESTVGTFTGSIENNTDYMSMKQSLENTVSENEKRIKTLEDENKKQMEEILNLVKEKQKSHEEKQNNSQNNTEIMVKLKVATEKINTLTAEKVKLEGYLKTAKQMIRDERDKSKSIKGNEVENISKQYQDSIQDLRRLLIEKEKEISNLKRIVEESKEVSTREINLISSALYEMGLEMQRMKVPKPEERSKLQHTQTKEVDSNQPKSLLGKKRLELEKRV